MIYVVETGVDRSIVILTIAEHVAWCDPVAVEMFTLRTDYHSGTYLIYKIQSLFVCLSVSLFVCSLWKKN